MLGQSAAARQAMCRHITAISGRDLSLQRFETQAANDDQSRPDLIGITPDGAKGVVVEVKFWAGLTEAQPVGYLSAMQHPGVLLFVAPEARLRSLWGELLRRLSEAGHTDSQWSAEEISSRAVGDHVLCATSWRILLNALHTEAEAAGDTKPAADIRQLLALCDHIDREAFLPLSSEEITATTGRRILQFGAIASELTDYLVQRGLADVKGLRATHWLGASGRYLYLQGHGAFLHFSASKWADWGQSPIWLTLKGPSSFKPDPSVPAALRRARIEFRGSRGLLCSDTIGARCGARRCRRACSCPVDCCRRGPSAC